MFNLEKKSIGRHSAGQEYVKRVAEAIMRENPELSEDRAYAIATKQLQRYGYLRKGTREITEKGRSRFRQYKSEKS